MAVTATPIFTQTPNLGVMNVVVSAAMTAATAFDGTDAQVKLVYTAGVNGSRVDIVQAKFTSTNGLAASGTSVATVIRFWINNGSANTVATNNQLLGELALPATVVAASATTALTVYSLPVNINVPAGYKLYAGLTVASGGTNIAILASAQGGDY
jgi:hypothetical protein